MALADHTKRESADLNALVIGRICYEDVEGVDWEGDEYYGYPHIYCYFLRKTQPYEHVGFYAEIKNAGDLPRYTEVASYDEVRTLSQKLSIK